jgi:hypothetical protein
MYATPQEYMIWKILQDSKAGNYFTAMRNAKKFLNKKYASRLNSSDPNEVKQAQKEINNLIRSIFSKDDTGDINFIRYLFHPSELHSRMMEFRRKFYGGRYNPSYKITEDDLNTNDAMD